jgi:hypothetical protein
MARSARLNRQFREVEGAINLVPFASRPALATLTMREYANAAKCGFAHQSCARAFAQVKSHNPQVHQRGIALWLVMAYIETRSFNSELHVQLMNILRLFKEIAPTSTTDSGDAQKTVA